MYACMHACIYACMYLCMYVCTYVCMYVCTYVCMYVYAHTKIHEAYIVWAWPFFEHRLLAAGGLCQWITCRSWQLAIRLDFIKQGYNPRYNEASQDTLTRSVSPLIAWQCDIYQCIMSKAQWGPVHSHPLRHGTFLEPQGKGQNFPISTSSTWAGSENPSGSIAFGAFWRWLLCSSALRS